MKLSVFHHNAFGAASVGELRGRILLPRHEQFTRFAPLHFINLLFGVTILCRMLDNTELTAIATTGARL